MTGKTKRPRKRNAGIRVKSQFAPGITREVVPDDNGGYPTRVYRFEDLPAVKSGPKS